jgi:hypothetical protein
MPGFSNAAERLVLEDVFGVAAWAKPTLHLALATADPGEDGPPVEPIGNGYARQPMAGAAWAWDAGLGYVRNSGTVTFPAATGAGWGTISHWTLQSALAAGTMLVYGAFDTPKPIGLGGVADLAAGGIRLPWLPNTTGGFTDYAKRKIAEDITGVAAWAKPAIYVGLSTANPMTADTPPVGGSYARVLVAGAGWEWNVANARIQNVAEIVFTTASAAWGTITHWTLYDALAAGNMLASGPLDAPVPIGIGDPFRFAVGGLRKRLE